MTALEVAAAITEDKVIVCEGKLRKVFFEPLILIGGYINAKRTINSTTLENGRFEEFGANMESCRLATPKETKRFTALKQRSKYLKNG